MIETAIFAGGCFWCMVSPFDEQPGIHSVESGYTGGHVENPTYEEVKMQTTGHTEAVRIAFDPEIISYRELVDIYWTVTDPTDAFGQFHDRGEAYRPVIFVGNEEQRQIAQKSKRTLEENGHYNGPIVTKIEELQPFYPAEDYHQDYYKKNPEKYAQEQSDREEWKKSHS